MPILIHNRIKHNRLRNERIARDPYYRVVLTARNIDSDDTFHKKFQRKNQALNRIFKKYKQGARIKRFSKSMALVLVSIGFPLIFLSYSLALALFIIALCFFYFIININKGELLNKAFNLGFSYNLDLFKRFIQYVLYQLEYGGYLE